MAKKLLESGERIALQDARNLAETGEKLRVQSDELKKLKAEIRAARNWTNRAKKCNTQQPALDTSIFFCETRLTRLNETPLKT